jgi:hypothetical protein
MTLFDVTTGPVFRTCGDSRLPGFGGLPRRSTCGRTLPIESFTQMTGPGSRRCPVCNTCRKLWEQYRISYAEWQQIAERQGGVCAIVGCETPIAYGTTAAGAHTDHDHACRHPGKGTRSCPRCVRGLLCASCNVAIGHLERNPQRVQGWTDYLANWASSCPR